MARSAMVVLAAVVLGLAGGCKSNSDKMRERQKARDAEKKAQDEAAEAKRKASEPKIDWWTPDEFWEPADAIKIASGKPCPEGLWSLFPTTPGEGQEQEANEAKRASLLEKVKGQTFVAQLRHGQGLELRKYNPKKKTLTVEVEGLVECFDGAGLLSVAWGDPAKPYRPKADEEEEGGTPQAVWRAQPILFALPFDSAADAKAFAEKDGIGAIARMVFTLGKADVDTKVKKTAKPNGEEGEDQLDWGAGRLVHVRLIGARLSSDHEKKLLAEKRP